MLKTNILESLFFLREEWVTAIFGDDENKDKEDGADEGSKAAKAPEKQKAATTVYDIGPDEDREFEAVTSTPVGSATRGRGRGRGRSPGRGGRGRGRGGADSVTKVGEAVIFIMHIRVSLHMPN